MDVPRIAEYTLGRLRKEMPPEFVYHSVDHTIDVVNAVLNLARLEQVTGKQVVLLEAAAYFHEIGMIDGTDAHEVRSAAIAEEVLSAWDVPVQEIGDVCRLIRITDCKTPPQSILEMIICDADLDYLGRDDYFELSGKLRKEWELLHVVKYSDSEWCRFQASFLEKHDYFCPAAKRLRHDGKMDNLNNIRKFIANH